MISLAVFAAMAVTVLLCYLVPVMLCWAAGRREKKIIACILLGAFGFAAPQLLIRLPALQLLGMAAAVQRSIACCLRSARRCLRRRGACSSSASC